MPRDKTETTNGTTTPAGLKRGHPMIGLAPRLPGKLLRRTIFWLNKTAHKAQARAFRALEPLGIDPRHYLVLMLLEEYGPQSQQEVSRSLNIDPAVMVSLVDDLESLKALRREVQPHDRRAYALHLTPKGVRLIGDATRLMDEMEQRFFSVLSKDEHAQLLATLKRLHD
jgi:DNA-binding MarR family transcriptional regulator